MDNRKKTLSLVVTLVIYLLLDYWNLLSKIGLNINRINLDVLNILIIIVLYVTTFILIDHKQLEKEKNKIETSKLVLKGIYENCLDNIDLYTDEIIKKHIVPKCNFDKIINEDTYFYNLVHQPFQNEPMLLELLKDGVISTKLYEDYIKCKRNYIDYVVTRITFFENAELSTEYKNKTLSILNQSLSKL